MGINANAAWHRLRGSAVAKHEITYSFSLCAHVRRLLTEWTEWIVGTSHLCHRFQTFFIINPSSHGNAIVRALLVACSYIFHRTFYGPRFDRIGATWHQNIDSITISFPYRLWIFVPNQKPALFNFRALLKFDLLLLYAFNGSIYRHRILMLFGNDIWHHEGENFYIIPKYCEVIRKTYSCSCSGSRARAQRRHTVWQDRWLQS